MIATLRFIGVLNAAIWFGGALFFTFSIWPASLSSDLREVFGETYTRVIAFHLVDHYYRLFYWCGIIALVHQLAEWVYLGKALQRLTITVLAVVFSIGLLGGFWMQPRLKKNHEIRYAKPGIYTPQLQEQAARRFKTWNAVAHFANVVALCGLAYNFWRITAPPATTRFVATGKFRS